MSTATPPPSKLVDRVRKVFIVAHREDIRPLESELQAQGFEVEVVRGPYTDEQQGYCAQIRCLVNHANAWRRVVGEDGACIVVEADFVPVRNFGSLPSALPDRPDDTLVGMAWLYSGSATLYGIDQNGFPFGNAGTLVAYQLTPRVATLLLDFFVQDMAVPQPGDYRPFDTYLGVYLRRQRRCRNYLPVYQYGEHGGIANKEHGTQHARGWHEADVLFGPLSFLPLYARGSRLRYRAHRLRGYLWGWMRLVRLRFYNPRPQASLPLNRRARMVYFAVARMFRVAPMPDNARDQS